MSGNVYAVACLYLDKDSLVVTEGIWEAGWTHDRSQTNTAEEKFLSCRQPKPRESNQQHSTHITPGSNPLIRKI